MGSSSQFLAKLSSEAVSLCLYVQEEHGCVCARMRAMFPNADCARSFFPLHFCLFR